MQGLNWDDVRHFLEMAHTGSLTEAASRLGVNQTTVSRRIAALETRLGKNLFERIGNRWLITPVGERLTAAAERMADEVHAMERHVMADSQELEGKLRVTVADACSQYLVMPVLKSFAQQYKEVDLEIIATPDYLDLAAREADIALRSIDEPPSNLVGRRIAQLAYAVYGTHDVLQALRNKPENLDTPCITWIGDGYTQPPWIQKNFPNTRRIYRASEMNVMLQMTRQSMGMAQIPCVLGDTDPLLYRIPVVYVEPGWGLWVLSHVDLRTTARVRVFRDYLVEELEKHKDLIEGRVG